MVEQIDSSYAFVYNYYGEGRNYIDTYLPLGMLHQFQLTPASAVIVQGLDQDSVQLLQLRPRKGSDDRSMGKIAFIASIRLPNQPKILSLFLSEASKNGIRFASIRTQGLRSEDYADIVCEGGLSQVPPLFNPAEAISSQLHRTAKAIAGEILCSSPVYYADSRSGNVVSSVYRLNIPVLRGEYRKVRFSVYGKCRPLRKHENALTLCRTSLDSGRTTLTLDLSIGELPTYLLFFESAKLAPGSPVTETILQNLPARVNVDALDAYEYVKYDPTSAELGAGGTGVRIGVIEMLLTCRETKDFSCVNDVPELKEVLRRQTWWDEQTSRISVEDLGEALRQTAEVNVPEDTTCPAFQKLLSDGRYAFLEHMGKGSFGSVNKYADLARHEVVAGKHIKDPREFKEEELQALVAAGKQGSSKHLVAYRDFFMDGEMPVIVMDCVENVLANHMANKRFVQKDRQHKFPSSLAEFVDMSLQLLRGLAFLHSGDSGGRERIIHADIKPANIGFVRLGDTIVWKLLDFGLTKRLPDDVTGQPTTKHGGTRAYASPQVLECEKRVDNDIYALGIVLFQVLNDWRHPSRLAAEEIWDHNRPIPEVEEFRLYVQRVVSQDPGGYQRDAWKLGKPFVDQDLPRNAEGQLKDIIYNMIELSPERRFKSVEQVMEALEKWGAEHLGVPHSKTTDH